MLPEASAGFVPPDHSANHGGALVVRVAGLNGMRGQRKIRRLLLVGDTGWVCLAARAGFDL